MAPTHRRRARRVRREAAHVRGAGETHVGHVRSRNEDSILVDPELGLYAVFDGIGGHNAGDVAARMAGEHITNYVRQNARNPRRSARLVLDHALQAASAALFIAGESSERRRGMGTTAVACLFAEPTRVVLAHAGDSRAYLLRDGQLTALTRDHTLVQYLVSQGKLSPRSARRSPKRNMITRSLGHSTVRPDVKEQTLKPGDRLLLCSDGLHSYTPERSIRRVLAGDGPPEHIAHELVALALSGAAPDNVSAVVITVLDGAPATAQPRPPRARTRQRSAG